MFGLFTELHQHVQPCPDELKRGIKQACYREAESQPECRRVSNTSLGVYSKAEDSGHPASMWTLRVSWGCEGGMGGRAMGGELCIVSIVYIIITSSFVFYRMNACPWSSSCKFRQTRIPSCARRGQ